MHPRRLVLALVLATLVATPSNAQAPIGPVDLALPGELAVHNATLLLGRLAIDPVRLTGVGAVGATHLSVASGRLTVCPVERGSQGLAPTLLNRSCSDNATFVDPDVRFAGRSWISFRGNYSLAAAPNATMNVFVPTPEGTLWAAVLSPDGAALDAEDGRFEFRPFVESSEVIVKEGRQTYRFNGTDWIFRLETEGPAQLRAAGIFGLADAALSISLSVADGRDLRSVLAPRVLLDLQEALRGPDKREPTRNATQLLADHGRVPQLLNGAVLGRLSGGVGTLELSPEQVSFVRLSNFEGSLRDGRLVGNAGIPFAVVAQGVAVDGKPPAEPPWTFAIVAWIVAGLLYVFRPPVPSPTLGRRIVEASLIPLGFVAWDFYVARDLGVSALRLAVTHARTHTRAGVVDAELGSVLSLFVFEAAAFLLAWLLVFVPLRIAAARVLPARWTGVAPFGAFVVVLGLAYFFSANVFALGFSVARL